MGKVFVHHPLKRAEFKRLTAPPPPPPEPVRLKLNGESCAEEKARRARERVAARMEREYALNKFRADVELAKSIFRTIWIESFDFCNWMKARFNEDPDLYQKIVDDEMDCLLVDVFSAHESKQCLYCGDRALKHAGDGWAGLTIMVPPEGRITEGTEAFSYLLCNKCGKLPHKAVMHRAAEIIVRKVRNGDRTGAVRKSEFAPLDIQYFGDRFDVLIARNRYQTVGFFHQLKNSDMVLNPEILDELA